MGMQFGNADFTNHFDISGVNTSFTIHAEVKWDVGNGACIFGFDTENGGTYYSVERFGGNLLFQTGSGEGTGSAITIGQWYGITLVRTTGVGWEVYLDGISNISVSQANNNSNSHNIGNWHTNYGDNTLDGVMDGLKIWSSALTPAQVLAEYGTEAAILQTGLLTEANLDDGARTTAQTGTNLTEVGTVTDGGEATYGIPDTDSPNLSLPTSTSITSSSVILGGTTDEDNGIAHAIITANGNESLPTNQEIIDGNYASELFEAVDLTISATGTFSFAAITGLTDNTTYGYAIVHEDAAGNEDAGSRIEGTFTTLVISAGGTLNLTAPANMTFDPLASIHIQFMGTGTLNWTNNSTSQASIGSTPNGGTINFINPTTFTINGLINGCEIRLYDNETPADGSHNTELAGVESNVGTSFAYNHSGTTNTIKVQMLAAGYKEIIQEFTLSSSTQTLTLFPEVEDN